MTSQGTASGRFTRAVKQRNLFGAEMAIGEMKNLSLIAGLDYLDLLAEVKPEKLESAALRWHGRLELEASMMTLAESQPALAALARACALGSVMPGDFSLLRRGQDPGLRDRAVQRPCHRGRPRRSASF